MRIEDVCELARGTLSDVNQDARTATEIGGIEAKKLCRKCTTAKGVRKYSQKMLCI